MDTPFGASIDGGKTTAPALLRGIDLHERLGTPLTIYMGPRRRQPYTEGKTDLGRVSGVDLAKTRYWTSRTPDVAARRSDALDSN